jgi:Lhr-like helicase
MSKELTTEMLEELRTQIKSYFETYYSALRNEIAGHDALYDSIPHYFKGQREVVTNICRDGVLIVHKPAETEQDSYVFESVLDTRVEDVVARYTPTLPSGESATIIDYSPYEDFGTFSLTEPLRQKENGRTYESEWTRMDIASWNNLGVWRDRLQARGLARNDLRPYLEEH